MEELRTNKIKEYLLDNMETLRNIIGELNSYNGCLEILDVYENDEEFFKMFFPNNAAEAVQKAHYGDYNWHDKYVRFDGYANLESLDVWKLEEEYKSYIGEIVNNLIDYKDNIYIYDGGLLELLEENEDEEEGGEDEQ